MDFSTLKASARDRGDLATDLTTPVGHLPDNGAVVFGMYATVEQLGSTAPADQ